MESCFHCLASYLYIPFELDLTNAKNREAVQQVCGQPQIIPYSSHLHLCAIDGVVYQRIDQKQKSIEYDVERQVEVEEYKYSVRDSLHSKEYPRQHTQHDRATLVLDRDTDSQYQRERESYE